MVSDFFDVVVEAVYPLATSAPATTRPCEALVPEPAAKAFSKPAVPPDAAAVNWSSVISMVQAPLPTGMPAKVASYRASSRPCAETECCGSNHIDAATHSPPKTRNPDRAMRGECWREGVTEGRSSTSTTRDRCFMWQSYPADTTTGALSDPALLAKNRPTMVSA